MAHLINTFDYELKERVESLKYFEKIDFYDNAKYMVVIFNNKTHYDTIKLISNNGDNISICKLLNNGSRYYYHKINNNNIIKGDISIVNMMLYDKLLILINPNFIKCINILTQEIVLDIDYQEKDNFKNIYVSDSNRRYYLFNNLIFYEKCINTTGWIYDTYIFNLDTYETKHLKKCSVYCKNRGSCNISNEYINKYNLNNYSNYSGKSWNTIISLNKSSIDNRFIFLNYHKQYMCLYDTLKNVELKHTIMYGAYYIPFFHNYIINYVTHEQSYHMIDFSNYISDIYEKENTTQLNDIKIDNTIIKDKLSDNEDDIKDAIIIEDELSDNDEDVKDKKCELKYNLYDRWMLDDEHDKCTLCYKKFIKFFVKKNHCRSCGRLACSPCTNFYGKGKIIAGMPVSVQNKIKSNQNVKICIKCHK